ncbi:acyltransferase [Pseudarthrobacter sp. PvP090]|uniref:acyltransferase family protein n=1 Tax=Pseudarthrobacter sp. PvP090 TaxID=3156393 RepID=UPI00339A34B9
MPTIQSRLDTRSNSLNFLRLILAVSVIVAHSTPIGGFSLDFGIGTFGLGTIAVAGFFAISGYLITRSRMNTPLGKYTVKRLARIFPGYWACLLFTAFVAAGIAGLIQGGWNLASAVTYVASNFDMSSNYYSVGTTLSSVPMSDYWNGSLWTLRYEVFCYFAVGLLLTAGFIRRNRSFLLVAFLISTVASLGFHFVEIPNTAEDLLFLVPAFLAGAVLYSYADKVPLAWPPALAALVLFTTLSLADFGRALGGLPIAYICIWIGVALPPVFRKINARNDISYGVYLYGAPVQQLLVLLGLNSFGHLPYILFSVVAVIPLAVTSWFLVEKPAMALTSIKWSRFWRHPQPTPAS